jgi:hypothetical protein
LFFVIPLYQFLNVECLDLYIFIILKEIATHVSLFPYLLISLR